MAGQSPFVGTPLGYADTINGSGIALSALDCGNGVRAGTKCFVAAGLQTWTLTVSAAVVDHVSVEAALNFPAMRWILDATPGTGTVTTVGSADGSVVITNPTTTPDLSVRVISAATPVALAAIDVNTAPSIVKAGSTAFIVSTGQRFTLRSSAGFVDDGVFVISTPDDASLIWVISTITEGGIALVYTPVVDLKVVADTLILPAMPYRVRPVGTASFEIKSTNAPTVSPTFSSGNSAAFDNYSALQTASGLITQPAETNVLTPSLVTPSQWMNLTGAPLKLRISVGATATELTARMYFPLMFLPV